MTDNSKEAQLREWLKFVTRSTYNDEQRVHREVLALALSREPWMPRTDYYAGQLLVALNRTLNSPSSGALVKVTLWLPLSFPVHPPIVVCSPGAGRGVDAQGRLSLDILSSKWSLSCSLLDVVGAVNQWLAAEPVSVGGAKTNSPILPGIHYSGLYASSPELKDRIRLKLNRLRQEAEADAQKQYDQIMMDMSVLHEHKEQLARCVTNLEGFSEQVHMALATSSSFLDEQSERLNSLQSNNSVDLYVQADNEIDRTLLQSHLDDLAISDSLYSLSKEFAERRRSGKKDHLQSYLSAYRDLSRRLFEARALYQKCSLYR